MEIVKYTWVWCLVNTILLVGLALSNAITHDILSSQIKEQAEQLNELQSDVKSLKFAMEIQPDTVVININQTIVK